MATQATTQAAGSGLVPYRVTVRQFMKMVDADVFPEGHHVELLAGVLVMMTRYPPHIYAVGQLGDLIRPILPAGWFIQEEKPLQLGRYWLPEPDFAVVRGQRADFRKRLARGGDIGLIAEVSDSTYPKDVGLKLSRYAAARIPAYWIVNVAKRQVEVYTDPQGRGRSARYQAVSIHAETDQVPVVIDGQERGRIAVADLLP